MLPLKNNYHRRSITPLQIQHETTVLEAGAETVDIEGHSVFEEQAQAHATVYTGYSMTGTLSKCKLSKPRFMNQQTQVFAMKLRSDKMA